jgi:hypothetical protein
MARGGGIVEVSYYIVDLCQGARGVMGCKAGMVFDEIGR